MSKWRRSTTASTLTSSVRARCCHRHHPATAALVCSHAHASAVCLIEVGFQYTLGTFMLVSCGLHHAVDEALHHVEEGETDDFLDSQAVTSFS